MKVLPNEVKDLIAELHENYPPRCAYPDETELQHHRYAGAVELVQLLITRLEYSNSASLTHNP